MFITLTSADDSQPIHVRAYDVVVIQAMDKKTTLLRIRGGGEVLVKETRDKVREKCMGPMR